MAAAPRRPPREGRAGRRHLAGCLLLAGLGLLQEAAGERPQLHAAGVLGTSARANVTLEVGAHGLSRAKKKRKEDGGCLCVFDIDRTLTGKQGETSQCSGNLVEEDASDSAYGGGQLTISEAGQALDQTFCKDCFIGAVSAGYAGGNNERTILGPLLAKGGTLVAENDWAGPSGDGGRCGDCTRYFGGDTQLATTLVLGCSDGTKQGGIAAIVEMLNGGEHNANIDKSNVFHFDDRAENIQPIADAGFNAIQISCDPRDNGGSIGMCGAKLHEITKKTGANTC